MLATAPAPTAARTAVTTDALARIAIAELIAFWAELPVDPIEPSTARSQLLAQLPSLRRLAEAVGA